MTVQVESYEMNRIKFNYISFTKFSIENLAVYISVKFVLY
jgi:hypothetical protein